MTPVLECAHSWTKRKRSPYLADSSVQRSTSNGQKVWQRAWVFVHREHGLIVDLAVTRAQRRRGIGERLYRRALRWIQDQGLKTAEVHVASANAVATRFWEEMGFAPYMVMMKMEGGSSASRCKD